MRIRAPRRNRPTLSAATWWITNPKATPSSWWIKKRSKASQVYKLKLTKKNGSVEYDYLDAKSFLPIKTEGRRMQLGQEILYESKIADYKPVEGVLMPFSLTQLVNGRLAMEITVDKMDANVPHRRGCFQDAGETGAMTRRAVSISIARMDVGAHRADSRYRKTLPSSSNGSSAQALDPRGMRHA